MNYINNLVQAANWEACYRITSYQNLERCLLRLHDALYEETNVLVQYYFIKALQEVNLQAYLRFAEISAYSKHGNKALFRNVLNHLYGKPDALQYCHPISETLPKVADFITVARKVFL